MGRPLRPSDVDFVASFEGYRRHVYRDAVGVETIGYGETRSDIISKYRATGISEVDAKALLRVRLEDTYGAAVLAAVRVMLSDNEYAACTSLAYNIGTEGFRTSTVVKRLNAGDRQGAADAILMWDKAGGRTLAGLTRRRQAERALFLSAATASPAPAPAPTPAPAVRTFSRPWQILDAVVEWALGIKPGSTSQGFTCDTDGGHAAGSLHYPEQGCRARDYGAGLADPWNNMARIARLFEPLAKGSGYLIQELFYAPTGTWLQRGSVRNVGGHADHVHVGIRAGVTFEQLVAALGLTAPTSTRPEEDLYVHSIAPGETYIVPLRPGRPVVVGLVSENVRADRNKEGWVTAVPSSGAYARTAIGNGDHWDVIDGGFDPKTGKESPVWIGTRRRNFGLGKGHTAETLSVINYGPNNLGIDIEYVAA